MIKKERKIPMRIRMCEALLKRLPQNHEKRSLIEEELVKRKAGYRGERTVDYYLSSLPKKDYLIFHDLRLTLDEEHFFQIDTLLVSPRFVLIIEVKNISGTLLFERSFKQLIRTSNEGEEGFPDPVSQVKRQLVQLREWFKSHQVEAGVFEYLVVISNSSTVLKTEPEHADIYEHVCHVQHLLSRIHVLNDRYNNVHFSEKEMKKIARLLLKKHKPLFNNILQTYDIPKEDIIPGVFCPHCKIPPMTRISAAWKCPICNVRIKDAHKQALLDYFLLFGSTINHRKCSTFLKIPSRSIVSKLLTSMDLNFVGQRKGRVYRADVKLIEAFAEIVEGNKN